MPGLEPGVQSLFFNRQGPAKMPGASDSPPLRAPAPIDGGNCLWPFGLMPHPGRIEQIWATLPPVFAFRKRGS